MFEKRLVVEVDGGQHGEEAIARRDEGRTRWSKTRLRRAEALCGNSGTPSPYPSPVKGEGMPKSAIYQACSKGQILHPAGAQRTPLGQPVRSWIWECQDAPSIKHARKGKSFTRRMPKERLWVNLLDGGFGNAKIRHLSSMLERANPSPGGCPKNAFGSTC